MVFSIIVFFLFNIYIFSYESKILIDFKKSKLTYLFLASVNTLLMLLAYKMKLPYYLSYFVVLFTFTLELLAFSKSTFNQAFLGSCVLIIQISITQLIFIPIYARILNVTPYDIFNTPRLFFYSLSIVFLILFLVIKITLKFIPIKDIIKVYTAPTYSIMISLIVLFILTYTIIDVIVLQQKDYIKQFFPIFIATPMLNAFLFYTLFSHSIKSVKMVAYKRKSDELEATKQKIDINRKNIQDKMLKDDLTNCFNRKYIMYDLENKYNQNIFNFGILFIDIDNLKKVNDTLGHHEGDKYIITISQILKTSVRENDLISRIGGDEFLIVLNDLKENDIQEILKRIKDKIKTANKLTKQYTVSASMGYTFVDESLLKTGVEHIIKIADDKMRIQKSTLKGE